MEIASDPTGLRAAPHFRCQLQVVYPLVTASNWRSHDLLPAWFPLFARVAHRIQENTYIHMCTKLPQVAQMVKNLSAMREIWVRRFPGEGHGNPLQYSCLENPHGQRSLAGYSPESHKELDMTELLSTAQHMCTKGYDEGHR